MGSLTSKTSSQAFFLRILKVILQLRDAARLAAAKAKRKLGETSAPVPPAASTPSVGSALPIPGEAGIPGPSDSAATESASAATGLATELTEVPAPMEVNEILS